MELTACGFGVNGRLLPLSLFTFHFSLFTFQLSTFNFQLSIFNFQFSISIYPHTYQQSYQHRCGKLRHWPRILKIIKFPQWIKYSVGRCVFSVQQPNYQTLNYLFIIKR